MCEKRERKREGKKFAESFFFTFARKGKKNISATGGDSIRSRAREWTRVEWQIMSRWPRFTVVIEVGLDHVIDNRSISPAPNAILIHLVIGQSLSLYLRPISWHRASAEILPDRRANAAHGTKIDGDGRWKREREREKRRAYFSSLLQSTLTRHRVKRITFLMDLRNRRVFLIHLRSIYVFTMRRDDSIYLLPFIPPLLPSSWFSLRQLRSRWRWSSYVKMLRLANFLIVARADSIDESYRFLSSRASSIDNF